jgi:hypothetical protein
MPSSGMLRHVAVVRTDLSEDCSSSIIKVTRISELGATLAVTRNRCTLRRNTLMMEALRSSKTLVLTRATCCNIPEDGILQKQAYFKKSDQNEFLSQFCTDAVKSSDSSAKTV